MSTERRGSEQYEAPALRVLGLLHDLTQQDKSVGPADGIFLMGVGPIGNASP